MKYGGYMGVKNKSKISHLTIGKDDASFKIGTENFKSQNAEKWYSIKRINDKCLRFEVRSGDTAFDNDELKNAERSEIADKTMNDSNDVVTVRWEMLVEDGEPNSVGWCVLSQCHVHAKGGKGAIPPVSIQLYPDTDQLICKVRWGTHTSEILDFEDELFFLTENAIQRGVFYDIVLKVKIKNPEGFVRVWVNGVKKIDYNGPVGYNSDWYWKAGVYRGAAPETLAVRIRKIEIDR
jgi:hypothetical protein